MPAPIQQQAPEALGIQHYLETIRRRHLYFLIPMFLAWLAVWGASWIIPAKYKSGTLILVEQPTMPKDYVLPNIADNLQERLQSISEQILSRSRLLHIVDELHLYANERPRKSPDDIVDQMRKDIAIELVRSDDRHINAFNVFYTAHDPHVAQQVTSELTNLFINENLEARQQESEGNTRFLEEHLDTVRQTLEAQEEKIRQYKAEHVGELPTQLGSNLQILTGLQSQLQQESDALNMSRQQRVYLETMLNQYRAIAGPAKSTPGDGTDLVSVNERLAKLKSELRDMSATYGAEYPEIRRVKDEIAKAQAEHDTLVNTKAKDTKTPADATASAPLSEATMAKDASMVPQLQSQLQANQSEIKNREASIAALTAKIADYQSRLNQEPIREQQLADLTRGYDQTKLSYDDLLKKKNDSAMATSMELLQEGEHFRIIDPPSLPLKPSFPDRLKFCGIGLLAGLALGAGVVWAVEMIDDRVYSELEIRKLLPVSVLSELPVIGDAANEKDGKRRQWIGWVTAGLVVATILAGSAVSYLKG